MQVREDGKAYAADVTIEELTDFMHRHVGELSCCCGATGWHIPEHEGRPVVTTLPTPLAHSDGMNAFPVSCSSCGRMELFSAQTVVSKLMGSSTPQAIRGQIPAGDWMTGEDGHTYIAESVVAAAAILRG